MRRLPGRNSLNSLKKKALSKKGISPFLLVLRAGRPRIDRINTQMTSYYLFLLSSVRVKFLFISILTMGARQSSVEKTSLAEKRYRISDPKKSKLLLLFHVTLDFQYKNHPQYKNIPSIRITFNTRTISKFFIWSSCF